MTAKRGQPLRSWQHCTREREHALRRIHRFKQKVLSPETFCGKLEHQKNEQEVPLPQPGHHNCERTKSTYFVSDLDWKTISKCDHRISHKRIHDRPVSWIQTLSPQSAGKKPKRYAAEVTIQYLFNDIQLHA